MLPELVTEKLQSLPAQPGCYLFKDKKGEVVYVGKAKSLRSRVRSYFQEGSSDNRIFIPILLRTIGDLETIVTLTEKEAAILENTLIKEHRPRYNVKLRDDKDYLCLRIGTDHPWPRLTPVRGRSMKKDGARYFGPYHSATAARRTLHLINKHFQLRTCSDSELENRRRPCLQYQIKRCPAPCVYEVDSAWYQGQVRSVAMFIEGRHDELSEELATQMHDAAKTMRFELAAVYRDQLRAIDSVRESQRVVSTDGLDRDVIGLYREGDLAEIALLHVRAGKLQDVGTYSVKGAEIPDEELVAAFLAQHYGDVASDVAEEEAALLATPAPSEILVPILPEGHQGIADWLSDRKGSKVAIAKPQRGARVDLLEMAAENARHAFLEKRRTGDDVEERLKQLQERLRLPTMPRRIECCDISHLGGRDTVGAVVAMKDGVPDKKHYRIFHVKGEEHTAGDDYAAMYEVLARRFRRGREAREALAEKAIITEAQGAGDSEDDRADYWDLPDLFVVDGGRGQLGVALAAAHDLGLHELSIVSLAKEKENVMGETLVDRVYLPGQKNPIPLRSHSASLFFLARCRDEAHRFSNRAREKLGKKHRFKSVLDDIRGIGPATKKALFEALGTVAAIRNADDAALLAVKGVSNRQLAALREALGPPDPKPRESSEPAAAVEPEPPTTEPG
ncbi:MAG: excinuclease ABC subunit UvrC [Polyangiaceae bacterium]